MKYFSASLLPRSLRYYSKSLTESTTEFLTGQPFRSSHPHLFSSQSPDAVVVGFDMQEFQDRRRKFFELMQPNSIAFIPCTNQPMMSNDIPYTFRQNSDFYYLTGISEICSNNLLVLEKLNSGETKASLFVTDKNEKHEKWNGPVNGVSKTRDFLFSQDASIAIHSIDSLAQKLFPHSFTFETLFIDSQVNEPLRETILQYYQQYMNQHPTSKKFRLFETHSAITRFLRQTKSKNEIAMIKKAGAISAEAYKSVFKSTFAGMSEAHIEAMLEFEVRMRGAQRLAYPPVVASGPNTCNIIHYVANNLQLKNGDLIICDGAAEYYLYSTDITRTWPVSGKFSKEQKLIYDAVLRIQKACIEQMKAGNTFYKLHQFSVDATFEELKQLNILQKKEHVSLLYPHSIGHPMGMDIHESEPSSNVKFAEGHCLTCEPGIYIPSIRELHSKALTDEEKKVIAAIPEEFRGIGVRIEDDIVITKHGNENMTAFVPKESDEIEYWMAQRQSHPLYQYMKHNYSF